MKIKILGTRAQIEAKQPGHVLHTGILFDNKILLDLGEKEFLSENPEYIFFTHFHPDHAYFEYAGENLPPQISFPIYAPEKHDKVKNIKLIDENETVNAGGYAITPVPVIHSLKVKSFGYIVEKNQKRVFFSSDVAWIEKKHRSRFGKLDMVITEGSYFRSGGMIRRDKKSGKIFGHTGIPDLVKMFEPFTDHIVIIHLGTWFMKDVEKGIGKIKSFGNKNLKVEPAYDGQVFEV